MELERLQVVIEASIDGYKDKVKKVKEITGEATKKVIAETDKIKKSLSDSTSTKMDTTNLDLYKAKIKETEETLADLKTQNEKTMNTPVKTASIDKYSSKIKDIKEQLAIAYSQMDHMQSKAFEGISEMPYPDDASKEQALQEVLSKDKAYQKLNNTVNKLTADLETQNVALAESTNLANKNKTEEFERQKKTIAEIEEQLRSLNSTLDENLKKQNGLGGRLSTLWDKLKSSMSKVNIANKSVKNSTNGVNSSLKGMNVGLKNSLLATNPLSKSIFRLSNMFKLMLLRMVMRKAFNAILAGFKDLAKANSSFNNTMSTLQNGFLQARNALSSAFAPALQVLSPLIINITNLFINAMNVIGMFTARLFGNNSTFIKAKKVSVDYAKSLDATADSAKKASRALASFDEINVIGNKGDVESGLPNPKGMFEEIEIPADKLELIDMLKGKFNELNELFKNIDFSNAINSFDRLKNSASPLISGFFSGLEWAYINIFIPFAQFTIKDLLPAFFDLLAESLDALSAVIEILKPHAIWLWDNFLLPFAKWTGGIIIDVIKGLTDALRKFSDWASQNQATVSLISSVILGFFAGLWVYNTSKNLAKFITGILIPAFTDFRGSLSKIFTPTNLAAFAIGALAAGIIYLAMNWDKLTPAQRTITMLGALALAVTAAAVAVAVFHTAWSVGLAAAAIVGGLALLAGTYLFTMSNAKLPSIPGGSGGGGGGGSLSDLGYGRNFATRNFNSNPLPMLASGGIIKSPTIAMIGEYAGASSNPEIVTPESLMRQIVREELGSMAQAGGDITIEMPVYLDSDVMYRGIKKISWEEYARSGESPFPVG